MTDVVRPMTAEDYFQLPEINQLDELIDGEYIVSPPPIGIHINSSSEMPTVFLTKFCAVRRNYRCASCHPL